METIAALGLVAVCLKFIDFLKYAKNSDWNGVLTQSIVWAAGIGAVLLFANSDWATAYSIGDVTLDKLNGVSLVLGGLSIGSLASAGADARKTFDSTDSAAMPKLFDKDE